MALGACYLLLVPRYEDDASRSACHDFFNSFLTALSTPSFVGQGGGVGGQLSAC